MPEDLRGIGLRGAWDLRGVGLKRLGDLRGGGLRGSVTHTASPEGWR